VRRAILSPVLLVTALVLQLSVVNRLPLPGAGPDLVLLTVIALALCGGPAAGAVTGFGAGLALDLAPPGSYLIGEYALVFCVIGYVCGRLRGSLNHSALLTIALAMAAAAAGEAAIAALGLVVSDPQVTWPAVRQVLPSAVIYDAAITPFLLYGVMRVVRWSEGVGRAAAGERQADGAALLAREAARGGAGVAGGARPGLIGGAGLLGGAGWLAGPVGSRGSRGPRAYRGRGFAGAGRKGATVHVPRTPRLREAAARTGDGWLGGGPRTGLTASVPRRPARPGRPPRLRPGSGSPGSAAARSPRVLPRSSPNLRMSAPRRRDGSLGRAVGAGPAGSALRRRGSGPPGSAFRGRPPSAGAAAGLSRLGAPQHAPKFRPSQRLHGGSSSPEMLRVGALRSAALRNGSRGLRAAALRNGMRNVGRSAGGPQRMRPARGATLRLRSGRRHDGVLGGGALGSAGALRSGSALRGGGTIGLGGLRRGLRVRVHRGLSVRPPSLRLGSGRRGDGTLGGGVLTSRGRWPRSRRAAPRFRSRPAAGGRSLLGRRAGLGAGKRVRFSSGKTSFLATLTNGRLGRRSTVLRVGGRRTGGLT
jgi:rod shape-determining protein MreD